MMFASPLDMEPGFRFRTHDGGRALTWVGVEPVLSRFPGKHRVRVVVTGGRSFVCDAARKFQVIYDGGRA